MDLSVIIPVCSAQVHIAACLRSVTRCPKEHIDMECIVVNCAEADEIAAIVNRYIERDSRIKLAVAERADISDVQNKGIETASGRYIMFLDADDKLCEDAWEQLESAVEEEYADFVGFSYITQNKRGKFTAQMLPISDVISTDAQEARRLVYADSVLNTCRGILFKSRIIRDNNIFFQADLLYDAETYFVSEYFEHCESYLMTKAMILYCPQKGENAMKKYSMEERIDQIEALYDYCISAVKRYNDEETMRCVKVYYFRVVTMLLCEYARGYGYRKGALETLYENALGHKFLKEFLDEVDVCMIDSGIRKYEYQLLRKGNTAKIRRHFSIKAMVQK